MPESLSAGTVSLGVKPNATGFGANLAKQIMADSGPIAKVGEELGLKLTAGLAIAGVAAAGIAIKLASDMSDADAKIQGNAQITASAALAIGDAFLATAGNSTFSGQQMAEAFAPVAGVLQTIAGGTLTTADSMTVMSASTTLAEASGLSLTNTTADLAAVMQSFGLSTGDAAETSNTLFNASRLTGVGLDTLTSTVDKLHGRLGIASPDLAQTSALMVDLANHGISGSRGVMVAQTALVTLLGGSKATNDELQALGVSVFDSSGKFVGMQQVLTELTPKLAGMSDEQRNAAESAIFGKSAATAMNTTILAGAQGLGDATAAVTAHGAAETAAAAASGTLKGQLETLKSGFQDAMTVIGEKMVPVLISVVGWFKQNWQWIGVLTGVILGAVVALKAYELIMGIVKIATGAWAAVQLVMNAIMDANPISIVIIAIAALVAGIIWVATQTTFFQDAWKVMTDAVGNAWNWLWTTIIQPVVDFIVGYFQFLASIVLWLWTYAVKPVADFIGTAITVVGDVIGKVFGAVGDTIRGAFNGVVDFVKGIFNTIIDIVNNIIDGINGATSLAGAIGINIGAIPHLPKLADSGTVLPTPGGTIVRVAEGGKAESVVDTGKLNNLIDAATSRESKPAPKQTPGPVDLSAATITALAQAIVQQSRVSSRMGIA